MFLAVLARNRLKTLRPRLRNDDLGPAEEAFREAIRLAGPALELAVRGAVSAATRPVELAKLVLPSAGIVTNWVGRARKGTAMPAPFTAPRTSFNGTITGHRSAAFADFDLDDVKKVKAVTGATVNDVVLGLVHAIEMMTFNPYNAQVNPYGLADWYRFQNLGYQLPIVGGSDNQGTQADSNNMGAQSSGSVDTQTMGNTGSGTTADTSLDAEMQADASGPDIRDRQVDRN